MSKAQVFAQHALIVGPTALLSWAFGSAFVALHLVPLSPDAIQALAVVALFVGVIWLLGAALSALWTAVSLLKAIWTWRLPTSAELRGTYSLGLVAMAWYTASFVGLVVMREQSVGAVLLSSWVFLPALGLATLCFSITTRIVVPK